MYERKQTMACIFGTAAPSMTVYDVHDWVFGALQVSKEYVISILVDNQLKTVHIKLVEQNDIDDLSLANWTLV
jgi:hypothetical protein